MNKATQKTLSHISTRTSLPCATEELSQLDLAVVEGHISPAVGQHLHHKQRRGEITDQQLESILKEVIA